MVDVQKKVENSLFCPESYANGCSADELRVGFRTQEAAGPITTI